MNARLVLTISKDSQFKSEIEYDVINNFTSDSPVVTPCTSQLLNDSIDEYENKEPLDETITHDIPTTSGLESILV